MSHSVRVNPIACEAHGMCAELLPERITLDEWGYPLIDDAPVDGVQLEHALRVVVRIRRGARRRARAAPGRSGDTSTKP